MGDDKEVNVAVRSRKEGSGFEDTADAAKQTGKAVDEAGTAAKATTDAFKELAGALGLVIGLVEIVSFFRESAEEAYKEEKALRAVAQAAIVAGQDMVAATREANEFTLALAEQTGVVKDELLSAYGKLLLATGNQEEAQGRLTLAANMAATLFNGDLGPAMRLVKAAAEGQEMAFKRLLGVHVEGTTAAEKSAFMIKYLETNFRDVSKATNDAAMEQDRANLRWTEFKEEIGGGVQKALVAMRDAFMLVKDAVVLLVSEVFLWARTTVKAAGDVGTFLVNVWKGPKAALAAYVKDAQETWREHYATVAALEDKATKDYVKREGDKLAAHKAVMHSNDLVDKEHSEKELLDHGKYQVAEFEQEQARIKKSQDLLKKNAAFIQSIYGTELAEKQALELKKIEIEERTRKVSEEIAKKALAMKKTLAKEEIKMQQEIGNATIGLLTDVFGQSKELSIVQAVINTYEGATKALAQGGVYGAVLAAIVIAAGLAQVANIEAASPSASGAGQNVAGAGFDDPSSDIMARQTGRKWAKDMTDNITMGWGEGLKGASLGGSVTNNNSHTTNINVSGGGIDPNSRESLKQLGRRLNLVMQSDSQRTVARRS